ncbi:hypothetical protein [Pseudonocardia asaccharolytica]|uniref:hypothetical protein n=1 Tax=Pseudonocardia asaccharolytica TaxID=54010 RepID=UPI0004124A4B|nr:hypothetical protein [Pseudonocardia asaccharolytica]
MGRRIDRVRTALRWAQDLPARMDALDRRLGGIDAEPRVARDVLRLIKAIEPDVVYRQSQWDADVPDELSTERLGFVRTCLIPYETMNLVVNVAGERTANTAVDSDFHRAAWMVFCTNKMMLETAIRDGCATVPSSASPAIPRPTTCGR